MHNNINEGRGTTRNAAQYLRLEHSQVLLIDDCHWRLGARRGLPAALYKPACTISPETSKVFP